MVSTKVELPDGSEVESSDLICEGCEKPISEHSCGSTFTVSSGAAATPFKTSPRRADPSAGPTCPHCEGRMHTNMASMMQDVECMARQYYVDLGTMKTPFDRIPAGNTLDAVLEIGTWARSLADPITYGKMETVDGKSGTYASLKPKTESKRKKKAKPAEAGERIEDLAAEVEPVGPTLAPAIPTATAESKRRVRPPKVQATIPTSAPAPQVTGPVETPVNGADEDKEARRAKQRAILAGR